jgi:hypothetical protein
MSLLYHLLRANSQAERDSDDEIVNVASPLTSPSNTRPSSPTLKGAAARKVPKPLHLNHSHRDPLRALPTDLSQRIFSRLTLGDLAKCSLVSKKWNRSQTINYGQSPLPLTHARTPAHTSPSLVPALPQRKFSRRKLTARQMDETGIQAKLGNHYSPPFSLPQNQPLTQIS